MIFRKTETTQPPTRRETRLSVIAADVNVLGTLLSDGMMDFGGTIDGNIRSHTLTVRATATVRGDIEADTVHIYGNVSGTIQAKNVNLYSGCRVEGIIVHEKLAMEDGAFLDGSCRRMDKPAITSHNPITLPDFFRTDEENEPAPAVNPLKNIRLISG